MKLSGKDGSSVFTSHPAAYPRLIAQIRESWRAAKGSRPSAKSRFAENPCS